MKFGKSIGTQRDGNVDLHYVDYKLLKKKIKDVVEQLQAHELNKALRANSDFDAELEAEIEQVNVCFAQKQQQLLGQTGNLSEELHASQSSQAWQASQVAAQPDQAAGSSPVERAAAAVAQRPEAFRRLVDILGEVDQLRKYAVWNAVAVVKILKKRRKQTHFGLEDTAAERAAWLSRQSFFSGSDIAELHAAIESLGHMLMLSELMPDGSGGRLQPQLENEPQQCPICLETISDMVELSCSHRFCWKCFVLGPIAFQPGEYRITQCPICRTETTPAPRSSLCGDAGLGAPSSEGLLTRFLRTYFPKEGFGKEADDEQARQQGDEEVRDVVGELVKALLADNTLPRPSRCEGLPQDAASGSSAGGGVPMGDFFQTLPPQKTPEEKQLIGAAQKLQWLQLASSGDAFALDGAMYCSLCSEPLLMEAVLSTPCKHHFHRVCVSRLEEPKCPLCGFQLPFDWFIPADHPCAEEGFRVVPTRQYRPQFPGGPSRGSHGYPLHRPPPVSLLGPSGMKMKSYLHKIVPMGTDEEAACPSSPSAPPPETAHHRAEAEASSGSDSSSEDSNTDEEHQPRGHRAQGTRRKHRWAYSAIGRMRLVEWSDVGSSTPAPAPAASAPAAEPANSSGAAGSAGSSASSMAVGAFAEPAEQRGGTVLLIGQHL